MKKNRVIILLGCFLILLPFNIFAQEEKTIWITDTNKQGIENIAIFDKHKAFLGVTKENGAISFKLPQGEKIYTESLFYKDTCFKITKDTFCLLPDILLLNQITITDTVNSIDLLWSFLKYNKHQLIRDTSLYYSLDFTFSIPDSNWEENVSGVLEIYIKSSKKIKTDVFLCDGSYKETGKINLKTYLHLIGIFPGDLYESYNIFFLINNKKQLKNFTIESDKSNKKFILKKIDKKYSSLSHMEFQEKNIVYDYEETSYKYSLFKYQLIFQKTETVFSKINQYVFPKSIHYLSSYKRDNMLVNTTLNLRNTIKPPNCKKIKLFLGKPESIYRLLR